MKVIDNLEFFEQGYQVNAKKLVVCFLKPDGRLMPDLFFSI
ncbi:MAG: hypothetical protein WCI90_01050 [Chlorobium sp.]